MGPSQSQVCEKASEENPLILKLSLTPLLIFSKMKVFSAWFFSLIYRTLCEWITSFNLFLPFVISYWGFGFLLGTLFESLGILHLTSLVFEEYLPFQWRYTINVFEWVNEQMSRCMNVWVCPRMNEKLLDFGHISPSVGFPARAHNISFYTLTSHSEPLDSW